MSSIAVLSGSSRLKRGRIGDLADIDMHRQVDEENFPQADGTEAAQTFRIDLETLGATVGQVISLKIHDAYVLDYTATGTLADDLTGLKAAIEGDPIFNVFASVTAIDTGGTATADALELVTKPLGYSLELADSGEGDVVAVVVEQTAASFGDGMEFGRAAYIVNGAATSTKPAGDIEAVLEGVVRRQDSRASETLYESDARANARRDVVIVRTGRVIVQDGASATRGQQIYVGTSAGAELGRFFNASGAGRTALPLAYGKWIEPHVIELKLGR